MALLTSKEDSEFGIYFDQNREKEIIHYEIPSQLLSALLEQSQDGLMIVEQDKVSYINHTGAKLLGYEISELIDKPLPNILNNKYKTLCKSELLKGGLHSARMAHKDGHTISIELSISEQGNNCLVGFKDLRAQKKLEKQLKFSSVHDSLTKLYNRKGFESYLSKAISRCTRTHQHFAILYLDFDNFKNINDTYRHSVGDKVLKELADRLYHCFRKSDVIARMNGDEFIVLLEPITDANDVESAIGNLRQAIQSPLKLTNSKDEIIEMDVSIGSALFPEDGIDLKELLRVADEKMIEDKVVHQQEGGAMCASALNLYQNESVSLAQAAKLAGVSIEEFISIASTAGVAVLDYDEDIPDSDLRSLDSRKRE